jgi:DMSO/TMAO reductase YedYZ heme-binding membrane subunit
MTIRRILKITGRILLVVFALVVGAYGLGIGFWASVSEPIISAIVLTVSFLLIVAAAKAFTLLR